MIILFSQTKMMPGKTNLRIWFFLLLVTVFAPSNSCAAEELSIDPPLPVLNKMDHQGAYSNVILMPDRTPANTAEGKHVVVGTEIEKIIIIPGDSDFKEEVDSFAQFRAHYAVYWSLFMVMSILKTAWAK